MLKTSLAAGVLAALLALCASPCPAQTTAATPEKVSTKQLIQLLLSQDLGTRKFPFPDVVHAATGKSVVTVAPQNQAHNTILSAIHQAATAALKKLNQEDSPIKKLRRINEASRFFEDEIHAHLSKQPQITCSIPRNNKGREQRSGYPDLLITHTAADGTLTHAYLDPKLFEEKSISSSLRTFYYEPRTHTNKIQHSALHLLIGISHDGKQGAWQFTGWKLCDLSKFHVRLKAEFQASNKDLYRPNTIIPTIPNKK
ncbi:MAG: hypothetical protein ACPG32_03200 [Akkermansiaceae bacterium]